MPGGACVLGFAPHSGWTAVVVIGGTPVKPLLLARERLELTDASLAGSKQPYHALEGLPLEEARARLSVLEASATRLAASGLRTLITSARGAGLEPLGAGILDAAGKEALPLASILASHALIHSADGNHFRVALAAACARQKLPAIRIRQRDLAELAASELGRPPQELAATITRLGREVGAPWGADQKSAALLAWLLLARGGVTAKAG